MAHLARLGLALAVVAVALAGCDGTSGLESDHDFVGRIVGADLSSWETSDGGLHAGSAEDDFTVGPGVVVLEDGTELVIPADTPGANMCPVLAGDRWDGSLPNLCFVVGAYAGDGPEVAWFGLLGGNPDLPDDHVELIVHDIGSGEVIVDANGRLLSFGLADEIDLSGCVDSPDAATELTELPDAPVHYGSLDVATGQVDAISCGDAA